MNKFCRRIINNLKKENTCKRRKLVPRGCSFDGNPNANTAELPLSTPASYNMRMNNL